jgi:hypothetical protein
MPGPDFRVSRRRIEFQSFTGEVARAWLHPPRLRYQSGQAPEKGASGWGCPVLT